MAESANKSKTKTQTKTKAKPTLATNPSEFEKESLKIERDACRLKILENDATIKDLKEQVKILSTRCNLFEKKRNDDAYNNLVSEPSRKPDKTSSTTVTEEAPRMNSNQSSTSPIDSLINLEVLRAAKNLSSNSVTPPSPDVSAQFQILELKLTAQVEALRSDIQSLLAPLLHRSPDTPNHHLPLVPIINSLKSSISASTQTDSEQSLPTTKPPPMLFSIPPPPIKSTCDMSVQTASSVASPSGTKQSTTGTQTQSFSRTSSLLGIPPLAKRSGKGHFAPLSESFLRTFGPVTSEKLKNKTKEKTKTKPSKSHSQKSKSKEMTKSQKSKLNERTKSQQEFKKSRSQNSPVNHKAEKDAILIDLSDPISTADPEPSAPELTVPKYSVPEPAVPKPSFTEPSVHKPSASETPTDPDLIDFDSPDKTVIFHGPDVTLTDIDSPEVSDSFGDPLETVNDKSPSSQTLIDLNC